MSLFRACVDVRRGRPTAAGVITAFSAVLDPVGVGLRLYAVIRAVLERPEHDAPFIATVRERPAIVECHHTTGDYYSLLKVRVPTRADLDRVITQDIETLPVVARTYVTITLSSPEASSRFPPDHVRRGGAA